MHKGEIIEKVVRNLDLSISHVAELCNLSRKQLYNIFKSPDVKNETILKIGKGINHDFSQEFPWLVKLYDTLPELKPKILRAEEDQVAYLAKKRTEITVSLDGSEDRLEEEIEKLRKFNEIIKTI